MTLSRAEEIRIQNIETQLLELQTLIRGAASKEMLNRLLTLCNDQIKKDNERVIELTSLVDILIEKAKAI